MRRMTFFVMALALVLGFTQCKKDEPQESETEVKTVGITLKVDGNSGSKHDINTASGSVTFQNGDVIYVGDGNTYIGTLIHNGTYFSGSINEPADETVIYFYFVGGLMPSTPPSAGTTSSFTVDISNQSSKMPVLSCNHVTYKSGTFSYSCKLQNQCALVKFTTASTTAPVHVGGLYTEAQINFATPGITHTATTGFVNLNPDASDNTAKWAVLLPQTSFVGAEGVVADQGYTISMPAAIEADAFLTGDAAISFGSTSSHHRYLQWASGNLTLEDGDYVYGTLAGNYKISIADGATVTLDNVTINGVNNSSYRWAGLTCLSDATIILADGTTNTIKGFYYLNPGIQAAKRSGEGEEYTLTIQGTGTLNASSNGSGAGIGGGWNISCGNIAISSGTVNVTGGERAAGIGGGNSSSCGTITIGGGKVTATSTARGAGIGSGYSSSCGAITINGGTVEATGGDYAAGIGSGCTSSSCSSISIKGGTVTATSGSEAAAIGCGSSSSCGDITISSGIVIADAATASSGRAGIGCSAGSGVTCGDITISGGTVTATGGYDCAGIGSGVNHTVCGDITISGGSVTATGGGYGAGIGSAFNTSSCGNIKISGGTVEATGGSYAAGIGISSWDSSCGTITILNTVTRVTATRGSNASNSIGKGSSGTFGTVTIGGTVYWDGSAYQNNGNTYLATSPLTYQP